MLLICAWILLVVQSIRAAIHFIGAFACDKCTDRIGNFITTLVDLIGVYVCLCGVILI